MTKRFLSGEYQDSISHWRDGVLSLWMCYLRKKAMFTDKKEVKK